VEVIAERAAFRAACNAARAGGHSVGLVPTMGALHEGHRALLAAARERCGFVGMTLFVNPLQFGPGEDLRTYPRTLDADLEIAERAGADIVFRPSVAEMYPGGEPQVRVDPGPLGDRLEGAARPGHFRGVLTVVAKLFGLAGPCHAFFGEKDAQQLALIRRMVLDLDLPVEIVACPTVREADGLATSSRNVRLSPDERAAAPVLWQALTEGRALVSRGVHEARRIRETLVGTVTSQPLARLDDAAVVDVETWEEVERIERPVRLLLAARFGATRLIDNTVAMPPAFAGADGSPADPGDRGE
jgi:pantoate--beta-alanine ligase